MRRESKEESTPKGGAQLSPSRSGKQLPYHSRPAQCSLQTIQTQLTDLLSPSPVPSPSADNPCAKNLGKNIKQVCSDSLVPGGLPELGGNQGVIIRPMTSTAIEAEKGEIISTASLLVDAAELPSKAQ